jgi:hypothetical protein
MEAMPGQYAPPAGELLLTRYSNGTPVGCVGLRPIEPPGCCEMKRLCLSGSARLRPRRKAGRRCREGSRADRLPRNEAGHPPLNGRGRRAVPKVRVRAHRALLRHSRDRHDLYATLAHRSGQKPPRSMRGKGTETVIRGSSPLDIPQTSGAAISPTANPILRRWPVRVGERADNIAATSLRRIGQPLKWVTECCFLASDEASFIAGTELVIDGGFIAQ